MFQHVDLSWGMSLDSMAFVCCDTYHGLSNGVQTGCMHVVSGYVHDKGLCTVMCEAVLLRRACVCVCMSVLGHCVCVCVCVCV